jgi:hypothetical protein
MSAFRTQYYNDTWKFRLTVLVAEDQPGYEAACLEVAGDLGIGLADTTSDACEVFSGGRGAYVILRNQPGSAMVGTVAHEALHVVSDVLSRRDITLERCEEAYCFLIGWVVEQIHAAIAASVLKRPPYFPPQA